MENDGKYYNENYGLRDVAHACRPSRSVYSHPRSTAVEMAGVSCEFYGYGPAIERTYTKEMLTDRYVEGQNRAFAGDRWNDQAHM